MRLSRKAAARVLLLATLAASGCSDSFWKGRAWPDFREIVVTPRVIRVGEVAQANAFIQKTDGSVLSENRVRITYSSSSPAIAAVERETGRVVGVAPGRAVIFAAANGRRVGDTVTVIAAP